ncbi:hypothetical protein NQ314_018447 [Rhamnusium bicolor]|uniref:DDE Tnp4 domain-containing protein n=1 Tax=Rhamnusium bicolor TaxID=1586634 RepID=A0AAV8WR47_9CUCU|nr:hypothetical protein NQ314_018447 [Rhamnusium bicolor]
MALLREDLEDLTDDEDFLELVKLEAFPRAPRNFRNRENHFLKWNENEFRERFRLSKETVQLIVDEIRDEISFLKNNQIRTRNPIERFFGVFKRRFPVLALGIRLNVHKVEAIVVACAVLHNIARQMGEPELAVNQEVEEAIENAIDINLDNPVNVNIGLNMNNLTRYNLIMQYFQGLL